MLWFAVQVLGLRGLGLRFDKECGRFLGILPFCRMHGAQRGTIDLTPYSPQQVWRVL